MSDCKFENWTNIFFWDIERPYIFLKITIKGSTIIIPENMLSGTMKRLENMHSARNRPKNIHKNVDRPKNIPKNPRLWGCG